MFGSHLREEEGVSKVTRNINRVRCSKIPICLQSQRFLSYEGQKWPKMSSYRGWGAPISARGLLVQLG